MTHTVGSGHFEKYIKENRILKNKLKDKGNIFKAPDIHRSRTSDVIAILIEQSKEPGITLRALTGRLGDRTFGMLLVLISIFNVLPFVSFIGGLLIATLGVQMVLGRTVAWLPSLILDRPLPHESVQKLLKIFEPRVKSIERYIHPRFQCTEAPIVDQINGIIIFLLGLIISLPFPFTNIGPAFIVIIMGLGLLERDGLLQISSALVGVLMVVAIYHLLIVP